MGLAIEAPCAKNEHTVQFYATPSELAASAGAFLADGLLAGGGAAVRHARASPSPDGRDEGAGSGHGGHDD
jgi:hypothetical protein